MAVLRHFFTITRHRLKVCAYCFKVGLVWQGLTHDLSKYSPSEFFAGVRFYQGNMSPQVKERVVLGYSGAWLHHKGRNKHHFEYWRDVDKSGKSAPVKMPAKYFGEMVCDRIAASQVYLGDKYTDASPWEYYERSKSHYLMHPASRAMLEKLLRMVRDKGQDRTFAYIKALLGLHQEY